MVTMTMSLGVSGMLSNGSRMVGSGSYPIRSSGVVPYKMGPTVVKPTISGVSTTVACKSMEKDIAGLERFCQTEMSADMHMFNTFMLASTCLSVALPVAAEVEDGAQVASSVASTPLSQGLMGLYGGPKELAIAFSPVFVYGLFYAFREYVNPRAKISDVFFIIGALVVFGNIFSILIFKKRIY